MMKSMISNRTKTEYGRVSISMSEREARAIQNGNDSLFKKHLNKCLIELDNLRPYDSLWVRDNEPNEQVMNESDQLLLEITRSLIEFSGIGKIEAIRTKIRNHLNRASRSDRGNIGSKTTPITTP